MKLTGPVAAVLAFMAHWPAQSQPRTSPADEYRFEQEAEARFQKFRRERAAAPEVNALTIAQDYASNLQAADAKYKGKRLVVHGLVMRVDFTAEGTPVLLLMNHREFPGVAAILRIAPNDDRLQVLQMQRMTPVRLYCGGEGFNARARVPVLDCGLYTAAEEAQQHYPGWRGLAPPAKR